MWEGQLSHTDTLTCLSAHKNKCSYSLQTHHQTGPGRPSFCKTAGDCTAFFMEVSTVWDSRHFSCIRKSVTGCLTCYILLQKTSGLVIHSLLSQARLPEFTKNRLHFMAKNSALFTERGNLTDKIDNQPWSPSANMQDYNIYSWQTAVNKIPE